MPVSEHPQISFPDHCRRSIQGLRGALIEIYRSVGANPTRPQDVSRRFGLNRNLTWKISRIIGAEDAFEAVPMLPGPGGLDILIETMEQAGASKTALTRLREAIQEFDHMVEIHTGDRGQLELVLDSMGVVRPADMSRKLAFKGNSGIWGIQADVRVTTHFLAPSKAFPGVLDLAIVGGLTRLRRLRAVTNWPVFQLRHYNDDGSPDPRELRREAIELSTGDQPGDPWLMRSFCSGAVPQIHLDKLRDTTLYKIGDGPIGKTGEFSCFFGFIDFESVPRYRDASNTVGELISSISVPVEAMQFDLFVHEELTEAMHPSAEMFGTLGGAVDGIGSIQLPMSEQFNDLGPGSLAGSPLVDRYTEATDAVCARLNRDPAEFRCLRLLVEYPPMSSRVVVRYELPEAP